VDPNQLRPIPTYFIAAITSMFTLLHLEGTSHALCYEYLVWFWLEAFPIHLCRRSQNALGLSLQPHVPVNLIEPDILTTLAVQAGLVALTAPVNPNLCSVVLNAQVAEYILPACYVEGQQLLPVICREPSLGFRGPYLSWHWGFIWCWTLRIHQCRSSSANTSNALSDYDRPLSALNITSRFKADGFSCLNSCILGTIRSIPCFPPFM